MNQFDFIEELDLRKFVAPEFVYGKGAINLTGRYAKNLGLSKVLVVSDEGVVAKGWTERVLDSLDAAGVSYSLFTAVNQNPRDFQVSEGAEVYAGAGCDAIVAVGGGSPMDCAKGIGIAHSNRKPILSFEGIDNVPIPGPPLICIPTTAGSSADMSQFAIITDTKEKRKIAIVSKSMVPDISLVDPETTTTMDKSLTAHTGLDALTHAVEAFVSTAHSPLTDLHALEAIRLIFCYLPKVLQDPLNITLRSKVMRGSLEAGLAFSNAILGAAHAMAHSLGGYLDYAHGECNAILLSEVVRANFSAVPDRYRRIAAVMDLDEANMTDDEVQDILVKEISLLAHKAGVYQTLGDLGVTKEDIPRLADNALRDPCLSTNPKELSKQEIIEIYERCL
ncbi:MAG: alcohol dehydrogenase-like regulatory protein ErcA [Spirochaetia bacterium]